MGQKQFTAVSITKENTLHVLASGPPRQKASLQSNCVINIFVCYSNRLTCIHCFFSLQSVWLNMFLCFLWKSRWSRQPAGRRRMCMRNRTSGRSDMYLLYDLNRIRVTMTSAEIVTFLSVHEENNSKSFEWILITI